VSVIKVPFPITDFGDLDVGFTRVLQTDNFFDLFFGERLVSLVCHISLNVVIRVQQCRWVVVLDVLSNLLLDKNTLSRTVNSFRYIKPERFTSKHVRVFVYFSYAMLPHQYRIYVIDHSETYVD
jgi:hypothetical protein